MPLDTTKLDIMRLQQLLRKMKASSSFDLVSKYNEWEQQTQDSKEYVLWSPAFREQIVASFGHDEEVKSIVEKLYLQILNELYDAQEAIRDKIKKATTDLLDEVNMRLGV
jgi:hypothetical protein